MEVLTTPIILEPVAACLAGLLLVSEHGHNFWMLGTLKQEGIGGHFTHSLLDSKIYTTATIILHIKSMTISSSHYGEDVERKHLQEQRAIRTFSHSVNPMNTLHVMFGIGHVIMFVVVRS